MAIERVREYLAGLPEPLEVIEFEESTHTSELAALALGVEVGQIAKSLVFVSSDRSMMVVTSGDVKVDQKRLKEKFGGKWRFADAETAEQLTGYPPGGVCPFSLPANLPIYIDSSMRRFPVVYAAAGSRRSAVPITVDQLLYITMGNEVAVCSSPC